MQDYRNSSSRSIEPETFSDADEIDDDPPSGGRDDERLLFDTEWSQGED